MISRPRSSDERQTSTTSRKPKKHNRKMKNEKMPKFLSKSDLRSSVKKSQTFDQNWTHFHPLSHSHPVNIHPLSQHQSQDQRVKNLHPTGPLLAYEKNVRAEPNHNWRERKEQNRSSVSGYGEMSYRSSIGPNETPRKPLDIRRREVHQTGPQGPVHCSVDPAGARYDPCENATRKEVPPV